MPLNKKEFDFFKCLLELNLNFVIKSIKGKRIKKLKLTTLVEGDPKAPFSIATTPRCRGGRYSIPRIAPLYP